MTAARRLPAAVTLPPFSRRWWGQWHHRVMRAESVGPMVAAAMRGKGWTIRAGEEASCIDFVAVAIGGDAHERWRAWYARHGIVLPRPTRAPVIFVPGSGASEGGG